MDFKVSKKSIRRTALSYLAAAALTLGASGAHADDLWCTGLIKDVIVYKSGNLMVYSLLRNSYLTLCNTQTDRNGVGSSVCVRWYDMAMQASRNAVPLTIYYNDPAATSCTTIPDYANSPAPGYLLIKP